MSTSIRVLLREYFPARIVAVVVVVIVNRVTVRLYVVKILSANERLRALGITIPLIRRWLHLVRDVRVFRSAPRGEILFIHSTAFGQKENIFTRL